MTDEFIQVSACTVCGKTFHEPPYRSGIGCGDLACAQAIHLLGLLREAEDTLEVLLEHAGQREMEFDDGKISMGEYIQRTLFKLRGKI